MADEINTTNNTEPRKSGNTGIAFIVGALVVVVAVLAYFVFYTGEEDPSDVTITIEGAGEAVEGAAEAVEDATQPAEGGNAAQ